MNNFKKSLRLTTSTGRATDQLRPGAKLKGLEYLLPYEDLLAGIRCAEGNSQAIANALVEEEAQPRGTAYFPRSRWAGLGNSYVNGIRYLLGH